MSFVSVSLAFCGFAVVLWLLYQNDYRAVLRTVADVGGGLAIVVVIRGVLLAVCGLARWCLLRGLAAVRVPVVVGLRTVGEAVNVLLPVAAVGGDVVRARLLNFSGVAGGAAAASALVDLLLQAGAQALFALIGIALLMQVAGGTEIASWAARGVGIAALALGGVYVVQRFGGAHERGLGALSRRWPATAPGSGIRLHESLQAIYANRPAIAAAFSLHELAWLLGALETWIALWLMGVPVSATEPMILESFSQARRAAAFPVPSALGVQEGGFSVLGALFGIPREVALALSFVKRVPDLTIGLPGLLAWYWLEMQRLLLVAIAVPPPGPHGLQAVRANGLQSMAQARTKVSCIRSSASTTLRVNLRAYFCNAGNALRVSASVSTVRPPIISIRAEKSASSRRAGGWRGTRDTVQGGSPTGDRRRDSRPRLQTALTLPTSSGPRRPRDPPHSSPPIPGSRRWCPRPCQEARR